jgi:hypothetical protein
VARDPRCENRQRNTRRVADARRTRSRSYLESRISTHYRTDRTYALQVKWGRISSDGHAIAGRMRDGTPLYICIRRASASDGSLTCTSISLIVVLRPLQFIFSATPNPHRPCCVNKATVLELQAVNVMHAQTQATVTHSSCLKVRRSLFLYRCVQ